MINFLLTFVSIIAPLHDFHTSWMNMTYDEGAKAFDVTWRTDTEHLEGAIQARTNNPEFTLDEITEVPKGLVLYLNENVTLDLNGKKQALTIDFIESTFAETVVHFKPIKYRRKLKSMEMKNTLLLKAFPNQKNMLQLNYEGKSYSMLFSSMKMWQALAIE
ncbi:hypothetical protein N9J89_00430 [Bacteroidia bacterium]|jgi:hypothetical protein|nr:hypothetical protein [Bacteroidota bacterium]MDA9110696.1 hypothetical protein [Bacteroidia bacterium]